MSDYPYLVVESRSDLGRNVGIEGTPPSVRSGVSQFADEPMGR